MWGYVKANQVLSNEEIKILTEPSDFFGWSAVLFDWIVIGIALDFAAEVPHPLVIALSMIVIGGRQLALGILVHETVHRSLFKTRSLNDFVGRFICGAPIWQDLYRYREHHLKHHNLAGGSEDPDFSLVSPFPVTRTSLIRKCMRDLSGLTGLKRLFALFMMDFGFLTYTIAADPKKVDQSPKPWEEVLKTGFKNIWPMITAQLVLITIFYAVGKPWLYLIWAGSYLTTFSLFLRLRSIAEHACTEMDLDPLKSTRTVIVNHLERVTLAPHNVNFHIEHHLLMTVPYFNLPMLHRVLMARGALKDAQVARGYTEVFYQASSFLPPIE